MDKVHKISLIDPVGGHGGMDFYNYGLAFGLSKYNIDIYIYTSSETGLRNYTNVYTFYAFKDIWKSNRLFKVLKYLCGHLLSINESKKESVKIVHYHFFTYRLIDLVYLVYAKLRNLKIVVTIHDIVPFDKHSSRFTEKLLLKFIDGIVVHNSTSYDILLSTHNSLKNVIKIPHGNYFPFVKSVEKINPQKKKINLLFFGQIKKVKGLDLLILAIKEVTDLGYDVELVIAGKPWKEDLDIYRNLIISLRLQDYIKEHYYYIPNDRIYDFFCQSDLVVLPYRVIYQSGVLLLTLSHRIPVLCSDLDAFKEVVIDEETGFLFKSGSHHSLANKIIDIINNRHLLEKVKNNAYNRIAKSNNWEDIGKKTLAFYESLLNNHN